MTLSRSFLPRDPRTTVINPIIKASTSCPKASAMPIQVGS